MEDGTEQVAKTNCTPGIQAEGRQQSLLVY